MDKFEKIEKLNKLRENGSLTEKEFEEEKKKILEETNTTINISRVWIIIPIILILGILIYAVGIRKDNTTQEISSNKSTNKVTTGQSSEKEENTQILTEVSFSNMNSDDEVYTNIQKDIIEYFDYDYFPFYSKNLQRYPQIFNNAKVSTIGVVMKVIESTDERFKVVIAQGGGKTMSGRDEGDSPRIYDQGLGSQGLEEVSEDILFVLQGEQLNERLLKGDVIQMYGRYEKMESFSIDGKTYNLPVINSMTTYQLKNEEGRFEQERIKAIAEYIFGKDIKFSKIGTGVEGICYNIVLDNQSNGNFKAFNMRDEGGPIYYDEEYNNLNYNISKKLWVGADFEHYLVTTYDNNTKHAYLEAFDKSLNKMWSREFDFNDNSTIYDGPIDFTNSKVAVVIDNDLYIIDAKTGENLVQPVLVGNKVKVDLVNDGVILIGDSNKDSVMKVSFEGKIVYRNNGDTDAAEINYAYTQMVDNKMVIYFNGITQDYSLITKFMVVAEDGTIESISNDLGFGE